MKILKRIIYTNKNFMREALLSLVIICLPLFALAQTAEKQHYIYNIVSFEGGWIDQYIRIKLDNGKEIKTLRDKAGNKMKFNTPAAAFMYLTSEGWELYFNVTSNATSYTKNTLSFSSCWIIRKPCTKEELDKAVDEGIRK